MEYKYVVIISRDGLGGDYETPRRPSWHRSLKAATRAARKYGFRDTTDGAATETVAFVERLADGAQLHPWATNEDWQSVD